MIKRDTYLRKLISVKENGFPKVLTGIRRCGKSYLLFHLFKDYLLSTGVKKGNIIEIALDELDNLKYRNPFELNDYVLKSCSKEGMNYVFIDEIQLVDSIVNPALTEGKYVLAKKDDAEKVTFVDVILGLSRKDNIDLYVTGSNSKMLSTDIVTEFRDKATNISIRPLSFEEFYSYRGGSETDAIYEYMMYGGMPLAVLKEKGEKENYLKNLFDITYIRDILEHNHLNKSDALDEICTIISQECGQLFNAKKIADSYQSITKEKIDKDTVTNYIEYFKDAFVLSEANRYDVKGKRNIGALRKYYFADNGLRNARLNFAYGDEGQMLETMVYNELLYHGYTVNVGTFEKVEKNKLGKSVKKNYEIDFVAKKGIRQYYIQVSSDISSLETRMREIKPYVALNDQIKKLIVINKPIDEMLDPNGFTVIGIAEFLLRFLKD